MSRRCRSDQGLTLIELLISVVLSLMLIGVLGTALVAGLRGARATTETLENSADAQAVSNYLPQDIQSIAAAADITTASTDRTGCSDDATATGSSVVRLRWAGDAAGPALSYSADYRIDADPSVGGNQPNRWRLTRYFCATSPTTGASLTVVARNLADPAVHPPVVSPATGGLAVKLTDVQTDGSLYTFSISGTFRTVAAAAPGGGAVGGPPPIVVSLNVAAIEDTPDATSHRVDGKIDVIHLSFSAEPQAACDTGWIVTGLPTDYTAATTAVITANSTQATLAVTAALTAGYATAASGAHLAFTPAAGCMVLPVASLDLADQAAPVLVSIATTTPQTAGKMESGDVLALTFSEAITAPASPATITETDGSGNNHDTISIAGVTAAASDLGSKSYVESGSVTAPGDLSADIGDPTGHTVLTVKVAAVTLNGSLPNNGGPPAGVLVITPNALIKDRATTPNGAFAQTLTTSSSFQVF